MICFCRWINHHYCAMIMAVVSLTWEIKGQPNCAQKQVTIFPLDSKCVVCLYLLTIPWILLREGYNCSCNGLWCKELQCFCKIDINARDSIPVLLWERYHLKITCMPCKASLDALLLVWSVSILILMTFVVWWSLSTGALCRIGIVSTSNAY